MRGPTILETTALVWLVVTCLLLPLLGEWLGWWGRWRKRPHVCSCPPGRCYYLHRVTERPGLECRDAREEV